MVTYVYVKFNYDRLRIDKALGNFRKSDNNNKNKNNARTLGTLSGSPNKQLKRRPISLIIPTSGPLIRDGLKERSQVK